MTSQPTAAEKVFAIRELLEPILLLLPARDLLLFQRVNKFFRDTITGSKPLQSALWLRTDLTDHSTMSNRVPDLNPILTQYLHAYRERIFEFKGKYYFFVKPPHRDYPSNPLPIVDWSAGDERQWILSLDIEEIYPAPLTKKRTFASGIWPDMLISQPVCDIHLRLWKSSPVSRIMSNGMRRFEVKGGTLRHVLEQIIEQQRERSVMLLKQRLRGAGAESEISDFWLRAL